MKTGKMIICMLAVLSLGMGACQRGPRPIDYGSDACHFCRMTIVDRQHGAEIVTDKGKVFKFDAVECMVNSIEEIGADNIAMYLCNTYYSPGELIDATSANFLVSDKLQSPMGANLTAFSSPEEVARAVENHGGEIYTWTSLLSYLKSMGYVYHQ